ncbi:MAG: sulfatase family protein [Planctomycetota bacterium]
MLWIIADDFSPDLGCYGASAVSTPNIDRLAAQGIRYTNAFATAPVCSTSRSALITGMYQTSIACHQHRTRPGVKLPKGVRPITDYFQQAGYFVCNANADLSAPGKRDYNFRFYANKYKGHDWRDRAPGQPFFAQVQIFEPHRPFVKNDRPKRARALKLPPYYPDHPITRADWANYLASVEVLDSKVGKVLDRIKQDGLADNTVVFFFSDQGRPHVRAKQWLYDPGIRVPLIVCQPGKTPTTNHQLVSLIDISAASLILAGIKPPQTMQGRDFLDHKIAPRDAIFAARDRCDETVDRIRCVRTKRFKYIRNFFPDRPYTQRNNYKLLRYPVLSLMRVFEAEGKLTSAQALFMAPKRPAEELYDLSADFHEINNLAFDPAHQKTLADLRRRLNTWIKQIQDQGEIPEDKKRVRGANNEMRLWFKQRMELRQLDPTIPPAAHLQWWKNQLGLTDKR